MTSAALRRVAVRTRTSIERLRAVGCPRSILRGLREIEREAEELAVKAKRGKVRA